MIDTQELKKSVNIIEVAESLGLDVKRGSEGATAACVCPFHDDNKPSLVLQPETSTYHCMGCDTKGDVIDLVMKVRGDDFKQATTFLGASSIEQNQETAEQYLKQRGINQETLDHFNITYTENKITIPVPTGEKYRLFNSDRKYSHKKGTSTYIYKTREIGDKKTVFLCEGEIDAIKIWQESGGKIVAWAIPGANIFSKTHVEHFKDVETIYVGYDNDDAGRAGTEKVVAALGEDRCHIIQVPIGKDWCDYFSLGGDINGLLKAIKQANHNPWADKQLSHGDIINLPERDNYYIVDKLIPKGCTIIAAPPKSMKSFLMLHILQSFVENKPLFDHFAIEKPEKILLMDRENDPYLIQRRLQLLNIPDKNMLYYNNTRTTLKNKKNYQQFLEYIDDLKPGLIVFDSLIRFFEGSENSSEDVSHFFNKAIYPIIDRGINVIILHHNSKNVDAVGSSKMRGSTDFSAYPDCTIQIKKKKINERQILEIKQTDNRHDEELDKFGVEIVSFKDKINFIYMPNSEIQDNKIEMAKGRIIEWFKLKKNLTRDDFIDRKYGKYFSDVGRDTLDQAIKEMEIDGLVILEKGAYGKHIYNLTERLKQ